MGVGGVRLDAGYRVATNFPLEKWEGGGRTKDKTRGSSPHRCGHKPLFSAHHLGVLGPVTLEGGGHSWAGFGKGAEPGPEGGGSAFPGPRRSFLLPTSPGKLPWAAGGPQRVPTRGQTARSAPSAPPRWPIFIKRVTQMPWPRFVYVLGNCCGKEEKQNKNHPSICCQVAISAFEGVGGGRKGGFRTRWGVSDGEERRSAFIHPRTPAHTHILTQTLRAEPAVRHAGAHTQWADSGEPV